MSMFQNSVLKNVSQDESIVALRWAKFQEYLAKKEYTKSKKLKFTDKLEERNFKNDWKALFENDTKIALDLKSQINTTDKEIDKMVYALYGLSDDEVEIVEGIN